MGTTRMTTEVGHDRISDDEKSAKRKMKNDRKYMIDHIVCHVGKGANTRYVIRCVAILNPMTPSSGPPKYQLILKKGIGERESRKRNK